MEKFHREPVMIDQYTKGALPHLVEGRVGQRAAFFLLNGGGVGDLLQIVPEHTPPQPHGAQQVIEERKDEAEQERGEKAPRLLGERHAHGASTPEQAREQAAAA